MTNTNDSNDVNGVNDVSSLNDLLKYFRFVTPLNEINEAEKKMLHKILKEEHFQRETKRIRRLIQLSGIKRVKLLEQFDWMFNPKISRNKIMEFTNSNWIENACNLTFIGPAGVGKTHLASAICYHAAQKGHTTVFITSHDLIAKLTKARNPFSLVDYYSKVKVFCLDELGYVFPSSEHANCIFQIISKRAENLPTIITSNLIPSQWGKIFDSATATAILDRLTMKGTFIIIEGRSYRGKDSK